MTTPIGPTGQTDNSQPTLETLGSYLSDGHVLLLVLNAQVENVASIADTAVARASEIRSDGAVAWTAHGVAEDGRAFLAAPLGDSTSFAQVAKQSGVLNPKNATALGCEIVDTLVAAANAGQHHHSLSMNSFVWRVMNTGFPRSSLWIRLTGLILPLNPSRRMIHSTELPHSCRPSRPAAKIPAPMLMFTH